MMLGYVGPEAAAPVVSAIVAVAGALLIGWRWILTRVKRIYRFVFRIKVEEEPEDEVLEEAKAGD